MQMNNTTRIQQLEHRIAMLRAKGEEKNRNLINKAQREVRKLQEAK